MYEILEEFGVRIIENKILILNSESIFSIDKILQNLCKLGKFAFFDDKFPSISDEGAYFCYYFNADEKKWKMTLGNHGWSGGIYSIEITTIIIQIIDLIKENDFLEIQIEDLTFFSHYKEEQDSINYEMNLKLKKIHSNRNT